ncbi:ABC transporter substrate-binding protein [Chromobacterium violaceum]|uniref:ABC transporter substrate-binding protein n=1 Tax=Chromobacterium violaceum TaxID=536 RepID=UPI000C12559A|nr:ABC transporter substrate-binding protein [Chromobacterium violaceum]ATP28059.1 ABC transporter substrate-binding protein [Chromobacterium violaceum]ATP31969.1 ABC transporter substrate-binding protein [Chromobacterium violaceum]QIY78241.1 solute-binding protein [Chromobacterium violaceum]
MSPSAPPPGLPADAVRIEAATGSGTGGHLIAYSAFEPYELADYLEALSRLMPDVAITVWRMPTSSLTAFLLSGPEGDLVLGWADTAAQSPGIATRIAPPAPGGGCDADGFCRPTGFSLAFVADPALLQARGAVLPARWSDLASPALRQSLLFPDPRRSGAGYLALTTILQYYGPEDGWRLMVEIDRNVIDYPGSAWEPAARVGDGGAALGVTVRVAARRRLSDNPALVEALPQDAIGAEAEVYGILAGSRQQALARRALDWVMSEEAADLFRHHAKLLLRGEREPALFPINPERASRERPAVLQRFDALMRLRAARAPKPEKTP